MEIPEKIIEISFLRFLIESVMSRLPYMREVALLTKMKHTDDRHYENDDRSALIRDLITFLSDDCFDPENLDFDPVPHAEVINIFRGVVQHLDIYNPELPLQEMSHYLARSAGLKVVTSSEDSNLTLTFISDQQSDAENIEMKCWIISSYLQTLLRLLFGDGIIESIDILPKSRRVPIKLASNVSHISRWKREVSRITLNKSFFHLEKINYVDSPACLRH